MKLAPHQVSRRLDAMRNAFPEASVGVPQNLSQALVCIPDPNDRHVLAAAIRGKADAILTLNQRDFPPKCLAQYAIDRMSPDDFLANQYCYNPEAVLAKLDAQAGAIRETRATVIKRFRDRLQSPHFADMVEGQENGRES
jgi:PIN domain-containing protein